MVTSACLMSSSSLNDLAIVVVEDHDDARRYLDLFLGQLGAKVVVASNAFEGLRAIKNTLPNLVLSAIQMPGMDGYELLGNIRALGCRRQCIGYRNERLFRALRSRAHPILNAGLQTCLPKPYTPDRLLEMIRTSAHRLSRVVEQHLR